MEERMDKQTTEKKNGPDGVPGSGKKNRRKKQKRKKLIILAVILVAAAGTVIVLQQRAKQARQAAAAASSQQRTAVVERRNITSELSSSGTLSPKDTYEITSLVEGEIISADFEEGDQVEKGQVLYVVDSSSMESELNSAWVQRFV